MVLTAVRAAEHRTQRRGAASEEDGAANNVGVEPSLSPEPAVRIVRPGRPCQLQTNKLTRNASQLSQTRWSEGFEDYSRERRDERGPRCQDTDRYLRFPVYQTIFLPTAILNSCFKRAFPSGKYDRRCCELRFNKSPREIYVFYLITDPS